MKVTSHVMKSNTFFCYVRFNLSLNKCNKIKKEKNSPAFKVLQLTVVEHASRVLIHLLQVHIHNKTFFKARYRETHQNT